MPSVVCVGVEYPFYGTQWHPEKNIFEWTKYEAINHSPTAVQVSQHFANFFVNEARRNNNTFSSESELESYLIYHHNIIWGAGLSAFGQIYVFEDESLIDKKKKKDKKKLNPYIN